MRIANYKGLQLLHSLLSYETYGLLKVSNVLLHVSYT